MADDIEYHVGNEVFSEQDEAMAVAVIQSISKGGAKVNLDVVIFSEKGAQEFGGDCAVDVYREDPEASVHERVVVKAESTGRIA